MKIRAVQWNIGGGKIRDTEADATLETSYSHEGVDYCIERLRMYEPDIVTLQESHADDSLVQAEVIAEALGLNYFINDPYDQSHIDPSQKLCQSVLSRWPIAKHSFSFFLNPHYRMTRPNGEVWETHDKGITTCVLGEVGITLQTLHLIPFSKFGVDLQDATAQSVTASIESLIDTEDSPYLLQGDFNYPDLKILLPNISTNGLQEASGNEPTTPKGRLYDHVLARGMRSVEHKIDTTVLTDHFPLITTFEL